jgi:hypothetical protein
MTDPEGTSEPEDDRVPIPSLDRYTDRDPATKEFWGDVVADMEATAVEYRDRGWETLELHPGDVTIVDGERTGIDVLLPDDEYRELESTLADSVSFDGYQVYRAARGGTTFAVVAVEDTDAEIAVVYPVYYSFSKPQVRAVIRNARHAGMLRSYLRRLDGDFVELVHEDPDPFVPDPGD